MQKKEEQRKKAGSLSVCLTECDMRQDNEEERKERI